MFWKWFLKALAVLLILAVFVGGGIAIYKAGYSQGANTAVWLNQSGSEMTTPNLLPNPGSFLGYYSRPLILLPFCGLFLGFIFLLFFFGGVRRFSHYKIWKEAGIPGPESLGDHWHKYHHGPCWDANPHGWNPPRSTEQPAGGSSEPDPAEEA